jgi:thymidylate synthase (FAD)
MPDPTSTNPHTPTTPTSVAPARPVEVPSTSPPPPPSQTAAPAEPAQAGEGQRLRRIPAETAWVDVMGGASRHEIRLYDHGFIALIDAMPRLVPAGQTADSAIVQAARVSYGAGTRRVNEDRGLIRYLLRHRHTTPFEMVEFKFHVSMPIFIARQWIRHRTANVNEYSGRYSVLPDRFYRPGPDQVRKQSRANRQGSESLFGTSDNTPEEALTARQFMEYLEEAERLHARYADLVARGVSRELARIGLPVSLYTQWYWKCDLHNILRFLSLRMDPHAQEEIRAYAVAMHDLIAPIVPVTMEAFADYELGAVRLTRLEVEALRSRAAGGSDALATDNARERAEWEQKRAILGLA